MKAILAETFEPDLSGVTLTDVPIPEPGEGDVRVKVHAASLNPVDWKLASGAAPWWSGPHIVGLDAAGEIDAVGPGVTGWSVGDRVVWHGDLNRDGVFAEYAVAAAHVISRIPDGVSYEAGAAIPCAGYTAFQGLIRKARLEPGETVLVQGVTGGVGGFATQIAKRGGGRVIALARPEKADWAKRLGADTVLDYRDPDLVEKVKSLTGGDGADIFVEVARPDDARRSLELLRYNGQLVCIDPLPDISQTPAYTYAASIHEVALGGAYAANHLPTQRDFAKMGDALLEMLQRGDLDPMITRRISLSDVPAALIDLRDRAFDGKAVVLLDI